MYFALKTILFGGAMASCLFIDGFNRPNTPPSADGAVIGENWVNSDNSDSWQISGNELSATTVITSPAILYNEGLQTISGSGSNFTFSADVTAYGWAGIVFNYQNPSNYYVLRFKRNSKDYQLLSVVDDALQVVASGNDATATFAQGANYTLTVASHTPNLFDFSITPVDRSEVLIQKTAITNNGTGQFTGGYLGLYGSEPTLFDNVRLDQSLIDPLAKGDGLFINSVWSGHPVGFDLLTLKNVQVAAYYNQYRQVTLAARNINSTQWHLLAVQPISTVGWDSHNYLTMAVDAEGYLHLSGNMHGTLINYWRSDAPFTNALQLASSEFMVKLPQLANPSNESMATYPEFLSGPNGEFIFSYRNHTSLPGGGHGAGDWHLLKYAPSTQTFSPAAGPTSVFKWTDAIYSVYPAFKVYGGYIHCLYLWRESAAETNFRLSYIRSKNLIDWTDAFDRAVTLPAAPETTSVIIDDVPVLGGLLNGQPALGFSRDGSPLVLYHKYDTGGFSQVYAAKPTVGTQTWLTTQITSNTNWTWSFDGAGSLPPNGSVFNRFDMDEILDGLAPVFVSMLRDDGTQVAGGCGYYLLDETTLNTMAAASNLAWRSANVSTGDSGFVDPSTPNNTYTHNGEPMVIPRERSAGDAYEDLHYYLRWETLPKNRDQPRYEPDGTTEISPPPSALELYRTHTELDAPLRESQSPFYGRMFKPWDALLTGSMALKSDSARLYNTFLSSPAAETNHYAEWTFYVPLTREYVLGGSTYSLTESDNSFYVQVDDGPLYPWHLAGCWNYKTVTSDGNGIVRFHLSHGTHTLRVYAREPGAGLEYLWLNVDSTYKTSSTGPLSFQGFTSETDAEAVSGQSLSSPQGSPQGGNTAHYEIPVYQAGNHILLGRTRAQDQSSNGFYISINGAAQEIWDLPISGSSWVWAPAAPPMTLTQGTTLRLDVSGLEGGSELDSFMLLFDP